jgi:hypothetical protein
MGIVICGVTLISQSPWTAEQNAAVRDACREVLAALNPTQSPSDEEVLAYLNAHLEKPYSAVVYGERCAYTAYWQFCYEDPELGLLTDALEKHCRPTGMVITHHCSY